MNSGTASFRLEQYNHTNRVGLTVPGSLDFAYNYQAPINDWVHLAFVADGLQTALYVNGIFAQNNFFRTDKEVAPDRFIARFTNGRSIYAEGTLLNAAAANHGVDPLAEYNAAREPDLVDAVGWVPTLFLPIDRTLRVPSLIESEAGPFNWK